MAVTEIKVDVLFDESETIHEENQELLKKLEALGKAFERLASNQNLTGKTGESINAYIREVHQNGIIPVAGAAIDFGGQLLSGENVADATVKTGVHVELEWELQRQRQ